MGIDASHCPRGKMARLGAFQVDSIQEIAKLDVYFVSRYVCQTSILKSNASNSHKLPSSENNAKVSP
jgi:hypothetical protein